MQRLADYVSSQHMTASFLQPAFHPIIPHFPTLIKNVISPSQYVQAVVKAKIYVYIGSNLSLRLLYVT
jgi:hypothetical protein